MKTRRTYFDLDLDATEHPERGDVMLGPNTAYRVLDVWPTESRQWANRWTVTWEPLGPYDPRRPPMPAEGGRHFRFEHGRRG